MRAALLRHHLALERRKRDTIDQLIVEDLHHAALAVMDRLVSSTETTRLTKLPNQLEVTKGGERLDQRPADRDQALPVPRVGPAQPRWTECNFTFTPAEWVSRGRV